MCQWKAGVAWWLVQLRSVQCPLRRPIRPRSLPLVYYSPPWVSYCGVPIVVSVLWLFSALCFALLFSVFLVVGRNKPVYGRFRQEQRREKAAYFDRSQAPVLIVIHKCRQAGKHRHIGMDAEKTDPPTLVYNEESSSLGMQYLKLLLPVSRQARALPLRTYLMANGLRMTRLPSISWPSCMSSEKTVTHFALSAEAKIVES